MESEDVYFPKRVISGIELSSSTNVAVPYECKINHLNIETVMHTNVKTHLSGSLFRLHEDSNNFFRDLRSPMQSGSELSLRLLDMFNDSSACRPPILKLRQSKYINWCLVRVQTFQNNCLYLLLSVIITHFL